MRRNSFVRSSQGRAKQKLIYVKSIEEIPDFKSDDEIAEWYQTHSTVLIQDQLEGLPAAIGGKLRRRVTARRVRSEKTEKSPQS
jgi:hypothetical protein